MNDGLAHAEISFVENLRRITVVVASDEASGLGAFRPSVDALLRWLREYNEAFAQANQRWCGGRLHSFHQRQLTLVGSGVLVLPHEAIRIGRCASELGLSMALSVTTEAMVRYPLALPMLRSELPALYLQIECSSAGEGTAVALSPAERKVLDAHADSGGGLNFVGSVSALRDAGFGERESFNRMGFTIARPTGAAIRPMHRLHRVAPCGDYVGWYVGPAGDIFPCAGMAEHPPARLGNIAAPFGDALLALAGTRDAMVGLAERGPSLSNAPAESPFDLCALHRKVVTSLATL